MYHVGQIVLNNHVVHSEQINEGTYLIGFYLTMRNPKPFQLVMHRKMDHHFYPHHAINFETQKEMNSHIESLKMEDD